MITLDHFEETCVYLDLEQVKQHVDSSWFNKNTLHCKPFDF